MVPQIGEQIAAHRRACGVVPTVDSLQRIVGEVVQLALAAVVLRTGKTGGADPAVAGDGAEVHAHPEQFAVPRGELVVDAPPGCITIPRARQLDAGGIGKGLAADMVSAGLMRRGALGVLVNLGGDIRCRGAGPSGDWRVGIDHPDGPDLPSVARITLRHGALCTSGVRKRRWVRAGARQGAGKAR